jgi:hypothetical protein
MNTELLKAATRFAQDALSILRQKNPDLAFEKTDQEVHLFSEDGLSYRNETRTVSSYSHIFRHIHPYYPELWNIPSGKILADQLLKTPFFAGPNTPKDKIEHILIFGFMQQLFKYLEGRDDFGFDSQTFEQQYSEFIEQQLEKPLFTMMAPIYGIDIPAEKKSENFNNIRIMRVTGSLRDRFYFPLNIAISDVMNLQNVVVREEVVPGWDNARTAKLQSEFTAQVELLVTSIRLATDANVIIPAFYYFSSSSVASSGTISNTSSMTAIGRRTLLESGLVTSICDIMNQIEGAKKDQHLSLGLRRFNVARQRTSADDQIIDYAISLEATVLAKQDDELLFRLALLGSALIRNEQDKRLTYDILHDLYTIRSAIVHNGHSFADVISNKKKLRYKDQDMLEKISQTVRNIMLKYVREIGTGDRSVIDINKALMHVIIS